MVKDLNTEEKIVEAAKTVFSQKGLNGARMQEIADEAGINKALLHYYFRSKDKLFETIMGHVASKFFPEIISQMKVDIPLESKIKSFSEGYITFIQNNSYLPNFVINLLNQNPEKLVELARLDVLVAKLELQKQIDSEADAGLIKRVDAKHLLLSILSLCVFPFIGKPLVKSVFKMDEKKFTEMMDERKAIVPEIIIAWLKSDIKRGKK
jgi:AcrR family transcriptional regulator